MQFSWFNSFFIKSNDSFFRGLDHYEKLMRNKENQQM